MPLLGLKDKCGVGKYAKQTFGECLQKLQCCTWVLQQGPVFPSAWTQEMITLGESIKLYNRIAENGKWAKLPTTPPPPAGLEVQPAADKIAKLREAAALLASADQEES